MILGEEGRRETKPPLSSPSTTKLEIEIEISIFENL